MGALIDLTGKQFGRLTVLGRDGICNDGRVRWLCFCECGNQLGINGASLRGNRTKSCGCYNLAVLAKRNKEKHALPDGVSSRHGLVARYKREALKRGRVWELSELDFDALIRGECHYCGTQPEQAYISNKKSRGAFIYNGIDRSDNNKGYTPDNCVSCCGKCNWWKRSLSEEEFYNHARKILSHSGQMLVTTGGR